MEKRFFFMTDLLLPERSAALDILLLVPKNRKHPLKVDIF